MRRPFLVAAIVILLLALALRAWRTADLGIQVDEGAYLVIVEGLLQGKLPYRDLFLNHPPGFFWLMAGIFRLTMPHLFVGRWVTQLASVLTVAALMACGKLALYGEKRGGGAILAGLLFALTPLAIFWSRFVLLEHYETLLATLAMALALLGMRRDNGRFWLLSGFFAGLAALVKISGFILVPVMGTVLLLMYWRAWAKFARTFALWLLGAVVVWGSAATVVMVQGSWSNFGRYLSGADRLAPFENIWGKMLAFVDWHSGWLLLILAAIGTVFILLFRRRPLFIGLIWAVFEVAALFFPGRLVFSFGGFSHYAIPAIAALSLVAGSGVVWGWLQTGRSRVGRWGLATVLALCLLLALWPKWAVALDDVVRESEYPQLIADELLIGKAVRAVVAEDEAIQVFGNSGFYHWAERPLSTKFYLIPAYFSDSPLRSEAEADLIPHLADGSLAALLVTRMHLDERIWPELASVLWQNWEPVTLFSYPYQEDVFLFLPKKIPARQNTPLASIGNQFELHQLDVQVLENEALLVDLVWLITEPVSDEWVVFVHVLDEAGTLIAQNDSIPALGLRPATTWSLQEPVSDRHWLWLPAGISLEEMQLSIGWYRSDTGERLPLLGTDSEVTGDSFIIPLLETD